MKAVSLISIFCGLLSQPSPAEVKITFLDVGQGDSTVSEPVRRQSSDARGTGAFLWKGREDKEALQILDDLTKLAKQKYVAPHFFAGIHIGLRENDRAVSYLEKSYEEHSHWLIYLHIDPSMDDLRDDPRFQNLLRRVGLPPHKHTIPT